MQRHTYKYVQKDAQKPSGMNEMKQTQCFPVRFFLTFADVAMGSSSYVAQLAVTLFVFVSLSVCVFVTVSRTISLSRWLSVCLSITSLRM